jgi:hypothetical protein
VGQGPNRRAAPPLAAIACAAGALGALLLVVHATTRRAPELPQQRAPDPRLVAALRSKVPLDPIALDVDPYLTWRGKGPPPATPGTVCAVRFEADALHYRLATLPTEEKARGSGWAVTHAGACGTCSTLQDLAVYLERPDLTAPVRTCGLKLSASARLACIEGLGFTRACARTWEYNVENTRRECLGSCLLSWIEGESSTDAEGRLNPCLRCDEDRSGPIFKAAAGRTRRNSGIRSSIRREDEEIARVAHDYVPGAPER